MAAFPGGVMVGEQPFIVPSKRISSRTPPQTLTPGARVGRYQIGKVLRLGRAGVTYRARDTARGGDVALKEYLPVDIAARRSDLNVLPRSLQHVDDFVWGRDRFLAEARALAALAAASTPGIVGVDDCLEANGTAYQVTAPPPRETLASWLMREGPLEPDRMARLLAPLLEGLAQAHAAGVLHLDIKPANIALDDQGFARLFDFGGARAALAARLPASSGMPVTGYTAIEQLTFRETGPATDIYALAATLYESISGTQPPPATRRPAERLAAVPRKAAKAHGPRLLSAIQAGLAVEPLERPASIAAWRSMLDEAVPAAPISASTLRATPTPARPAAQSPPQSSLDAALAMAFTAPIAPGPIAAGPIPPGPIASRPIAAAPIAPAPITPAPITPAPIAPAPIAVAPVAVAPVAAGNVGAVAPPIAPLPAHAPAATVAVARDNGLASPVTSLLPGMQTETTVLTFDHLVAPRSIEPPVGTVAPPIAVRPPEPPSRTGAQAPTAASPVVTEAAMAASLRAIADAVAAAAPVPGVPRAATGAPSPAAVPKTKVTPVHADPQARLSAIASSRPAAPAVAAERGSSRPWERWKIALTATLAFATIPAGVAGYYVALPPSPVPPAAVLAPAADRLRGPSEAQSAAEAGRRAQAERDAARRRAEERADAEARRSVAAQAEAAAQQAAAESEARRQAEAAARQAAADSEARHQAEAAARQAAARQAAEADAEARRQADAATRRAEETAAAEAAARRREEEARAADDESRSEAQARLATAADARRRIEADYARAAAAQAQAEAEARQEAAAAEAALKMSNRDKRRVQVALTSLGHDTYGSDGMFGQRTRKMIAAWQKSRGEFESGYLTSPDLALLWVQAAPALARYERQLALEEQRRQEEEKRLAADAAAQPPATVIEPSPPAVGPPPVLSPPAAPLPQASQTPPPTPSARPQQ